MCKGGEKKNKKKKGKKKEASWLSRSYMLMREVLLWGCRVGGNEANKWY